VVSTESGEQVIAIRGYSHVNLQIRDLDREVAFYRDVLGFEVLPRPDFDTKGAWLQQGTAQIHLSVREEVAERVGFPHLALLVPQEEFERTCAAIRARGVEWHRPPRTREDFGVTVQAAFVEDPEGNIIELTTAGPHD
jgi:catechol 2,3-dioxygenase-like lactoylglutathione lyase family enzyme